MAHNSLSPGKAIVIPTVSRLLPTGELLELVYRREEGRTQFVRGREENLRLVDDALLPDGSRLIPYPGSHNLIRHEVLLLASQPEPPGSVNELVSDIETYLDRYVALEDGFRTLTAYYVLLTWVYDAFNELPYLRFRGEYGSGKTRALFVVGSLCYKAFFASGASTVSPIFHTLDTFRGTLLFDEADFRFTDEKAELVKILNNGNVRGFPVLRTAVTQRREFEPRAFSVFGPKLVAMRRSYEDEALESRFFTAEMGRGRMHSEIPINLPDVQREEALHLRNRLLGYRFAMHGKLKADPALVDPTLSPRLNQILVPLLSVVEDEGDRERIRAWAGKTKLAERGEGERLLERELLLVLSELLRDPLRTVSVGSIAARLIEHCGNAYHRPLTSRYVGEVLRERFGILPYKSGGVFVIASSEKPKIEAHFPEYGIPLPEIAVV